MQVSPLRPQSARASVEMTILWLQGETMIKPTIGRVVWYHPDNGTGQTWAALVCFVHSDTMVNLVVFDENGYGKPKTSVYLNQTEGAVPPLPYAEWMPYQVGQAKAQAAS